MGSGPSCDSAAAGGCDLKAVSVTGEGFMGRFSQVPQRGTPFGQEIPTLTSSDTRGAGTVFYRFGLLWADAQGHMVNSRLSICPFFALCLPRIPVR